MIHEATLDEATVDQLFLDVVAVGELLGVALKGGAGTMAGAETDDLKTARALLRERAVFGVQLRYRFAGREWWDTLMPLPSGVRLIRVDHTALLNTG